MNKDTNSLNWFEICVTDLVRAKHFYETAFGITLESWDLPGMQMLVFPSVPGNGKASGALVKSEMHTPSMDGSVIYLNADPDITPVLDRIAKLGGDILVPKTLINSTKAPKSTNGEEIKNENVTPTGNPAFENPINRGMEEQLQNGVIVPSNALSIFAFIP